MKISLANTAINDLKSAFLSYIFGRKNQTVGEDLVFDESNDMYDLKLRLENIDILSIYGDIDDTMVELVDDDRIHLKLINLTANSTYDWNLTSTIGNNAGSGALYI